MISAKDKKPASPTKALMLLLAGWLILMAALYSVLNVRSGVHPVMRIEAVKGVGK